MALAVMCFPREICFPELSSGYDFPTDPSLSVFIPRESRYENIFVNTVYTASSFRQRSITKTNQSAFRSVFRGWGDAAMAHPPRNVHKHFLTRYTIKNRNFKPIYFAQIKMLSKCRKYRFSDPNFKKYPGEIFPQPPQNCVVTMASSSLKSWLRHCQLLSILSTDEGTQTYILQVG